MKILRVRPIVIVLLLLLIVLQYKLWFEPNGLLKMFALKKDIAVQKKKNDLLHDRNDVLTAQVEQLKSSQQGVEGRARDELGMIKKGEQFYQIVNDKPKKGETH